MTSIKVKIDHSHSQPLSPLLMPTDNIKPPKRNRSAFIFYTLDMRKKVEERHQGKLNPNEVMIQISTLWKNLSPTEKGVYQAEARKDRERYYKELSVYERISGGKSSTNRTKKNHIKKPCSYYSLFVKDNTEKIRSKNPEMKMAGVLKMISELWRNADEATKNKYKERAEEERAIFEVENEGYHRTYRKHQTGDQILENAGHEEKASKTKRRKREVRDLCKEEEAEEEVIQKNFKQEPSFYFEESDSGKMTLNSETLGTPDSLDEFLLSGTELLDDIDFNAFMLDNNSMKFDEKMQANFNFNTSFFGATTNEIKEPINSRINKNQTNGSSENYHVDYKKVILNLLIENDYLKSRISDFNPIDMD